MKAIDVIMDKVICVLILYNPDFNTTEKVVDSILPQVEILYVADNSSISVRDKLPTSPKIVYEQMPGNIGIAAAQNRGIEYAQKQGFDYLIFLDQDSLCPPNLITELCTHYKWIKKRGISIGAIGPRAINRENGNPYMGLIKKGKPMNEWLTEVPELISSASLMEVKTFCQIGGMDSDLFIDGVDHEWCWRANSKMGYRFFIDESVQLSHHLGEGDRMFLCRRVAIPTPFRVYYQYRNYLILLRRNYVPLYWKWSNGIKYLIKFFYYPLFISPRKQYIVNMMRGFSAGLVNHKKKEII